MKNFKINLWDKKEILFATHDATLLSNSNSSVIENYGLTNNIFINGTNERLIDNGDNNNIILTGVDCEVIINGEDTKIYAIGYDNTIIVNGVDCEVYISKEASASVSAVIGTSIIFGKNETIIDGVKYMPNQFYIFE